MVPEMEKTATGNEATFMVEQSAIRKIMKFFPYAMDAGEVIVNVSSSGVRFYGANGSRTTLGLFYLNKKDMVLFEHDGEHTFAVDADDFNTVTNSLGVGALLNLKKKGQEITVEAGDGHKKKFNTVYTSDEIFIPELNYQHGMRVNGKAIYTAIHNLADLGVEALDFTTELVDGKVVLKLSGARDDKTEEVTIRGDKNSFPEKVNAKFDVGFLLRSFKLFQDSDVLIRYKKDAPLKVSVRIPVKSSKGDFTIKGYYLVAPRVPER